MQRNSLWIALIGIAIGFGVASMTHGTPSPRTPSGFVGGTTIGIASDHPKQNNIVFVNTTNAWTVEQWPPGQWNVVDCSEIVPNGTKAVALSTLLIIMHGGTPAIANLTVAVRRHGSAVDNSKNYHVQTIEARTDGGQRTPDTIWVALSPDRKFEIFWSKTSEENYPEGSAYGINMNLFAYLR